MLDVSRCLPLRGLRTRWISSVSKQGVFDSVVSAKKSKNWKALTGDQRIQKVVSTALSNPTAKNVAELVQLKRRLYRSLGVDYGSAVRCIENGISSQVDKLKFSCEFIKVVSERHYDSFVKALNEILSAKKIDKLTRRKELYNCIELHRRCNPVMTLKTGILLPDSVHQWFLHNIPKEDRLSHYVFLIDNTVVISGKYAESLQKSMLTGSKTEYTVATFQYYLNSGRENSVFKKKFAVMHPFRPMRRIVNSLIENNDLTHIREYLDMLTARLESVELKNQKVPYNVRKLYFMEFMHTLQFFARSADYIDMFFDILSAIVESLSRDTPNAYVRLSLSEILDLFQEENDTETVFKIMALFNKFPITKPSTRFTNEMLGRIIYSLRQYNDPRLSASYVLQTYQSEHSKVVLNDLGLWCLIFEGKFGHLPLSTVNDPSWNQKTINLNIPSALSVAAVPDTVILNELYRVVFDHYKTKIPMDEFKTLIIRCFESYCRFLKQDSNKYKSMRIDTSILRTMIHYMKFQGKDNRLAYEILMSFFSLKPNAHFNSKSEPFNLVLYGNEAITQQEFNAVLELMQQCNAAMDHKTIVTLILRYIRSGDLESAFDWYQRFLKTGYELKHFKLIEEAKKHGWKVSEASEQYYRECELKESLDNEGSLDDAYLQNTTDDACKDAILEQTYKLAELTDRSARLRTKSPSSSDHRIFNEKLPNAEAVSASYI